MARHSCLWPGNVTGHDAEEGLAINHELSKLILSSAILAALYPNPCLSVVLIPKELEC